MTNKIKNTSVHGAFSETMLENAEEWLLSLGIVFNATRFGKIKRIYTAWQAGKLTPNNEDLWAVSELFDLVELSNSFRNSMELKDMFIKKISNGSTFLSEENKTLARDLFFEAKIASRFKRAGFNILQDDAHDVVIEKEKLKFGIECKRPSNFIKLIERVKYAYNHQLVKLPNRLEQGIICVDLSKLLYEKFSNDLKLQGNAFPITTNESLSNYRDFFDGECKNLIQNNANEVANGVVMIVTHYRFPILNKNSCGTYDYSIFNHFCMMTIGKSKYIESLRSAFRDSVGNQF